jgi:cytochrome c-type biogenesis protein CcmH/NrfG
MTNVYHTSVRATRLNRLDIERLGRPAEAAGQFQDMLTDLKDRIAWKAAVRTRSVRADDSVELSYEAS